jgi:thioredoxin-related protein
MAKKETERVQKDDRILYAGPTIINEKFFLRKGQIFTEIPRYVPEELQKFFIPLADYSPEKEKELEELRRKYIKEQARKKANKGGK